MKALFDWWIGELASLLPGSGKRAAAVAWWRDGRIVDAGALPKGQPVTLRLADAKPWRRTLDLPASARRFLRQIVTAEMDRRTPWRADQVYFHVAPDPAPAQPGRMTATLSLVPRQAAAPALEALSRLGVTVRAIELEDGISVPLGAGRAAAPSGRLMPAVAALLAVALLSVAAQSVWLGIVEAELSQARRDAKSVRLLAAEIERLRRKQDLPHLKRQETQGALATLDLLARALPNDSWVETVTLRDGKLTMTGQSADATRLLPLIGASFANARFDAPVTASVKGDQTFALSAETGR